MRQRIVVLGIGALLLAGCGARGRDDSLAAIRSSLDAANVYRAISGALGGQGYRCGPFDEQMMCQLAQPARQLAMLYTRATKAGEPGTLMVYTQVKAKQECGKLQAALNEYNWKGSAAQASCQGDRVMLLSQLLVPKRGFDADELSRYVAGWWKAVEGAKASGALRDILQ